MRSSPSDGTGSYHIYGYLLPVFIAYDDSIWNDLIHDDVLLISR